MSDSEITEDGNMIVDQNSRFGFDSVWTNDDDGAPVDISNGLLILQVKDTYTKPAILIDAKSTDLTGSRIEITDGPNGKFSVVIEGADTLVLDTNRDMVYDLVYIADGDVDGIFIMKGTFTVNPTVSRNV